jgi:hypothetical protein
MSRISTVATLIALSCSLQSAFGTEIATEAADLGWYNSSGIHQSFNENTLTGQLGEEYRSFYLWHLPSFSGTVTSARIQLDLQYSLGSASLAPQTGRMFDVSAGSLDSLTLDDGGGLGGTIFDDLGSGSSYGDFVISSADDRTIFTVILNSNALSALGASAGQPFALGMRNVTESGLDFFLFSSMSVRGSQKLFVDVTPTTAVPEPEAWLMMLGGLALLARRRVRRHV